MTVRTADIVPGARIVTGRRIYDFPRTDAHMNDEFEVVTVLEDEQGLHFVNRGGTIRRFEPNPDIYSSSRLRLPHEVIWTVPVPEATDEELKRLVMGTVGVYGRRSGDKPWLLHVQSATDTVAYALPVLPRADNRQDRSLYPRDDAAPDYIVGNAAVWSHMVRIARGPEDWALTPGSLVVMWPGVARIVDGMPLHEARFALDVMRCTIERLGTWMPETMGHDSYYTCPFKDVGDIEEEEFCARLREEPNQALILGYVDGGTRGGLSLGTSGISFRHCDDVIVDVYGMDDPELGLWLADDATWTGSGEDVELDSDFRPATLEDLKRFGYSAEGVRIEIAGHFDVPVEQVPEDICEQLIRQAEEVSAVDVWKAEVAGRWSDMTNRLSETKPPIDYRIRYALQDFLGMARTKLLASDGMDLAIGEDEATLRWPGASITATTNGTIRVITPDQDETYPPSRDRDRRTTFVPLLDWLASRPEQTERSTPDDPRTVVPVRDDD